jgi:antirestriction protein ArdC
MKKTKGKPRKKNFNLAYEVVTDRFVKYIEEHGQLPWRKPWMVVNPDIPHMNYKSKTPYKGVNVFLCLMSGFNSPYWLTFKQAKDMGGCVKEGEHGTKIVRWQPANREKLKAIEEDDSLTEDEKAERKRKVFGFYKVFTVFNAEQIEGIEFPVPEPVEPREFYPLIEAEETIKKMPKAPRIYHEGDRAFYNMAKDFITLPPQEHFISEEHYYSTLFHELAHSTGHENRLGRHTNMKIAAFGDNDYSKEELVAELSSSFIMNELGFENENTMENSAAYLAGWCSAMKAEPKMLVKAMNKAIPATNYIFGREV